MASTITRFTWTDDTGTVAAPNNDGTLVNNSQLQAIFAAIDQMFGGAGSYATLVFGGRIQADGFGDHTFAAAGSGTHALIVRNTSAGTGNRGRIQVGNDAAAAVGVLDALSTTFTSAGTEVADGVQLAAARMGGLSLAATHASGAVRIYSGGTAERAGWTPAGHYRAVELSANPSASDLTSGSNAKDRLAFYMKGDKIVFAYNNAGVVTYVTLPLDGSTTTWTHNTTVP